MQGQFVSNLAPSNFGAPGVYVYNAPTQQVTPTGPALGKLGVIGAAQTGLLNTPVLSTSAQFVIAACGPSTTLPFSITRDALAALPECNQIVSLRVGDGTQTSATITMLDSAAASVLLLTAQQSGSLPNGLNNLGIVTNPAQASVSLIAGTLAPAGTVVPLVQISITYPNQPTEIYKNIVAGTATAGYVPVAFKANALAAINVGTALNAPSPRWTATAGASVIAPTLASFSASGGTDGAAGITNTTLLGVDGISGRTGMFALRGAINGGQFMFAGYAMATTGDVLPQAAVAFNNTEGVRCGFSFAQGTQTPVGQTVKAANNATDPTLDVFIDWNQMVDQWTGLATWIAPHAKGMGIISSLDYNQGPLNQPQGGGAVGVLQTEKFQNGINYVGGGEYATRTSAGINFLSKPNNVWALANPYTSDGRTFVSDARAAWFFGIGFMATLAPFLGKPQTSSPTDKTRARARAAINAFMALQLLPDPKINGYSNVCDLTNNTTATIAQGYLMDNIAVQTASNVVIILVNSQVGVSASLTIASS